MPGKSHGPRSLAGHKRAGHDLVTTRQQSMFEYSTSFIPLIIIGVYLVSSWRAGVGFFGFFFFAIKSDTLKTLVLTYIVVFRFPVVGLLR